MGQRAIRRELVSRTQIHKALIDCYYSRSAAAEKLGVSRTYLYERMKTMLPVPVKK